MTNLTNTTIFKTISEVAKTSYALGYSASTPYSEGEISDLLIDTIVDFGDDPWEKRVIVANAFSLQMLGEIDITMLGVEAYADPSDAEQEITMAKEWVSAVGHADTAQVFSTILGREIPVNRMNVTLAENDVLIIGQITGGRLPEGSTTLPAGIKIKWFRVTLL